MESERAVAMEFQKYFTPEPERHISTSFLQDSSPMIDFLSQIHPVESSPTAKVQSWSALLQQTEPFLQQAPTTLEAPIFSTANLEYGAASLSDFSVSSKPQRKRSLENAGFITEDHTPSPTPHSSTSDSSANRKKTKARDSSRRPLPERHARKQNFACDLCRKLKIKCVFYPGTEKCDRCERCDVECLDGSSMRAAAAAVRAQQGTKKRRTQTFEFKKDSSEPKPLVISTQKIQTRLAPDVFQEVLDEPNSIGIGSIVQVKKSTQHHYMAKESVVTRVVCKVVAVYLDGSESEAVPVNLVRLSEKWKNNLTNAIVDHKPHEIPHTSGVEVRGTSDVVPIPYLPLVDYNHSEMIPLANNLNPQPMDDGLSLSSNLSTSNYQLASAPLSLAAPMPIANNPHESAMCVADGYSSCLSDPHQTLRVSEPPINTCSINSAIDTPNIAFKPQSHTMHQDPSPTYEYDESYYGSDTMFSPNMPDFSLHAPIQTNVCTINSENGSSSARYAPTTLEAVSSPTRTSHSNQSSSPTILPSHNMSNLSDPTVIPEHSMTFLKKLQDLLNTIVVQNPCIDHSEEFKQSLESLNSPIIMQNALMQVLNESKTFTSFTTPISHHSEEIKRTGNSYQSQRL